LFAALILARIVHFTAALMLFGAAIFPLYAGDANSQADSSPSRTLYALLTLVALLSGLAWLACTLATVGAPSSKLLLVLTHTEFGRVWCFRLAVNVALFVLALRFARGHAHLFAFVAAIFLVSLAGLGHAATGQGISGVVRLGVQALHLACAGFWVGGLWVLWHRLRVAGATSDFLVVLSRFSRIGYFAVAFLLATGLVNVKLRTMAYLPDLGTLYGQLLAAKVAMVLAAVGFALANRFAVAPRLNGNATAAAALARNICAEQVFLFAAICLVAIIGETSPMTMPQ
jgi:copper resistance protein D